MLCKGGVEAGLAVFSRVAAYRVTVVVVVATSFENDFEVSAAKPTQKYSIGSRRCCSTFVVI